MKIGVTFGALAPRLHDQLRRFGLSKRRLSYLQKCADGVSMLSVGGFLTEAEVQRARQKIMKRILGLIPGPAEEDK